MVKVKAAAGRWTHLWAMGYFILLSLAVTWPLALNFTRLQGGLGDNVHFVFLIRWYARALAQPGTPLFVIPWLNYPDGWSLASTDTALAAALPGIPFTLLLGDAAGYNAAMLLTFILSGWAMFAWVRRLTGSLPAALLAGTIYACLPYRMAHYLIGHLNLSSTQWFPLFFWGLYDLLRARRWEWKAALLCGSALGLIALTSMYYLYMAALLGGIFVLGYLLWVDWRAILRPPVWLGGIAAGAVSLPLLAAGVYPFLAFNRAGGIAGRSVEYAAQYSASPTDFFLPFPGSWWWSRWMASSYLSERWVEQSLYIGAVTLVLTVLAFAWVREREPRAFLRLSAWCAAAGLVLGLGVWLNWAGQPVLVDGKPLPLPALLLFEHAPFFDKMRALARFGFFVSFFAAAAAGLGAAELFRRLKPATAGRQEWNGLVCAGLILLVWVDFAPRPAHTFSPIGPRAVDLWLAQQPGKGAVAVFPFRRQVDQDLVYYSLYHGKPYIGGFFSANYPDQYWRIQPDLDTFPSGQALERLRALGVEYILVEEASYHQPGEVLRACRGLGMPLLAEVEGYAVFGLPGE